MCFVRSVSCAQICEQKRRIVVENKSEDIVLNKYVDVDATKRLSSKHIREVDQPDGHLVRCRSVDPMAMIHIFLQFQFGHKRNYYLLSFV